MVRVSKQQKKKKQLSLSEGSLVEICTREKGLTAVWFEALVLDPNPPPPSHARSSSKRTCRVYVEYTTLLSDDGESPLRELVNLEYIRPRPPPDTVEGFELYDPVDAFYKDGWWTGVVTQLLDSNRYVVTFRKPPDELEFGKSDLRLHHRWICGKWLTPKRKNTTGLRFSVGKEVEVILDGDDYKDAWYPSKIIKDCGNGYFMVDCMRPNTEIEEQIRATVCSSHIRPCPPLLKNSKSFCLHDKVESFYDSGWWFGVVKEVLPDSRYVVVFQNEKKTERVLNHSELRPHMVWKDGEWHTSQGESLSPYCILEDADNCNGMDITQSAVTHGSQDASTNEAYGEKISSSLNSDLEMSEQPNLWWPSNALVSPIKRKRHLDLSKEGFSSESLSLIKCKKRTNGCKTPNEKIRFIFSSPNQSSMGNTARKASHKVDEQGSVSGPHRKRGRPQKQTAKLPQSIAQGKLKRKKARSSRTVVRTPDVLTESQISGFCLNAVETYGKENVDSVPIEKAVREGPVPMEKAVSEVPIPMEKTVREGPVPMEKAVSEGPIPMEKTASEGPIPMEKTVSEGPIPMEKTVSEGPIPMEKTVSEGPIPMEKAVSEGHIPMEKAVSEDPIPMEKTVGEGHNNGSEDDQPLSFWVGKVHTRTPVGGSRPAPSHQSLPFVKRDTFLWDILESKEAFKKLPQNPHFQPLQHREDFRRETLAIFYMGTFADLVDKACSLKLDEPRNTIDQMFDTLAELEPHGFTVEPIRGRLKEILSYKQKHENLQVSSGGARIEMEKQSALVAELMKKKAELEKSLSQVVSKLESKEKDIASLRSSMDEMNEELGHLSRDYEALICKPFEPPLQSA